MKSKVSVQILKIKAIVIVFAVDLMFKIIITLLVWMKELKQRQQKKLDEGRIAREKKDAIINEVRRILGPNVTQSDPRYTELLEKMEKEAKKAEKEAKKQESI